ncbi:MAG: acetyl-CoA C-acyltransferase [Deltaproteobacteria bacterium]|nr:acetyl-CoA C-acyltransferase [Deltaproteobacteria bacterium]NIS76369.1 acetyl-CoA C-acyltransferase [Deltaproteobacteria bacterium]
MSTVYIVSPKRTAIGRALRGTLKDTRPDDLAAEVIKGILEENPDLDPGRIDDIILGCAMPEAEQGMNVARIAAFKAGVPCDVPAMTINRFCSSGLQSIAIAADRVFSGASGLIVAGGTESMSMVPMGGNKVAFNPDLIESYPEVYMPMGLTAEEVVKKYEISREEQDAFALKSHQRAVAAISGGRFGEEIVPVETFVFIADNGGPPVKKQVLFDTDEGPREDTSLAALSKLRPAFSSTGTVTAGNSSQMSDGAAAVLVASAEAVEAYDLKPLARFLGYDVAGVPPEIMGIGPVKAIPKVLQRLGIKQGDIGLIELNEAFAAQSLAVMQELGLDPERVNVNGGAIALGHPLGCTGAKLTATLLYEMKRQGVSLGMVTMCIGGGMGAAGVFELM